MTAKHWLCLLLGTMVSAAGPAPLLAAAPQPLKAVEIREYEGQKLGSVTDFHENSIQGAPAVDIGKYRLLIDGLTEKKAAFSYGELQKMPHTKRLIELNCVEGWTVKALWEGIPLRELLKAAPPKPEAVTVVFHCADGYDTSLPLKEVLARDLIIADRINGLTLPKEQGYPFILVAQDKWGYKWARWIVRIELSRNTNYRGYWERSGYSQAGDLDGPILDR
ncbi:MAG: molybdopterin-dependent oxidoreductase [Deltaproteobacteria bacterium]|nr:molybdopterin-dependent oxidoreductase [Deltaproteobacteria bacterium]